MLEIVYISNEKKRIKKIKSKLKNNKKIKNKSNNINSS
jgi:hypothetical protein